MAGPLLARMYRFAELRARQSYNLRRFPPSSEIIFVPTSARGCGKRRCQGFPAVSRRWQSLARFPFSAPWGGLSTPFFGSLAEEAVSMLQMGKGRRAKEREREKGGGKRASRSLGRFSLIYCAIIGATLARASTSFSGHIEMP